MKPTISSKTITLGNSHWISHSNGTWQTLMYGSFLGQTNQGLSYRWVWIEENKVPKEVKELAK